MVLASPPASRPSQPGDGGGLADTYEETHVHGVYEAIASHFSATRHKPWPFVSSFLASRPPGSVGLDIGCGNGKNMAVNRDVVMLGCDRSAALVALARDSMCTARYRKHQRQQADGNLPDADADPAPSARIIAGADAVTADSLSLPFREASADFVICIAVIHHLCTRERRIDAIRQLLRCVRRAERRGGPAGVVTPQPHDVHDVTGAAIGAADVQGSSSGQVLVYVWALEQSGSRRGWAEGGEQDLLVPWVMKAPQQKKAKVKGQKKQRQRHKPSEDGAAAEEARTQHVDRSTDEYRGASGGEEGDIKSDGGRQRQRQQQQHAQDKAIAVDATADPGTAENDVAGGNAQQAAHIDKTFHRFYHLYQKGELEEEVVAAGGVVLDSGYERDNWWVIAG
jgi:tRNA (uracil-5-)-methyltransferase TRM9